MKAFHNYMPPSTADLERLKDELGFTGNQMAELAGLADGRQWRKYTGGAAPREMSAPMLFLLAAHLELTAKEIARVLDRMRKIGADFEYFDVRELDATPLESRDLDAVLFSAQDANAIARAFAREHGVPEERCEAWAEPWFAAAQNEGGCTERHLVAWLESKLQRSTGQR